MANASSGLHVVARQAASSADLRAALRRLLPASFPGAGADMPIRLAGEILVAGGLCDVVALLAQAGRSGTLVVSSPDAVRAISIERGDLVSASTTAPSERIGEMLYRSGEITHEDIDEAGMVAGIGGGLFGEALVALGRVEESTLESLLNRQSEEIFYAALRVDDGVFCFVDARVAGPAIATARPTLMSLLMEAARRMDEMLVFRETIGSSRHIPARTEVPVPGLPSELDLVLERCDGIRSIADIGRDVGLLEFESTRTVYELARMGLVDVLPPKVRTSADVIAIYNDVLIELHRRCDRLRSGDDLRRALDRFVACNEDLKALLHDVSPHDDGSLAVTKVLRNAGTTRRDVLVRRVLRAYVDFAVFHAGSLLPYTLAAELPQSVGRLLAPLADADVISSRDGAVSVRPSALAQ